MSVSKGDTSTDWKKPLCISACQFPLKLPWEHARASLLEGETCGWKPDLPSCPSGCHPHQQQLGEPQPELSSQAQRSPPGSLTWRLMSKTDGYCFKPLSFRVIHFFSIIVAVEIWYKRKFLFVTWLFLHNFLQQSTFAFLMEANKKICKMDIWLGKTLQEALDSVKCWYTYSETLDI